MTLDIHVDIAERAVLDPSLQYPSRNLFYDSVDDVFIYVQQGVQPLPNNTLETWQLPGSVISPFAVRLGD